METHRITTRFGPVDVRVYRLRDGWWPVLVGRHEVPAAPSLEGPLPRSVDHAVSRMAQAVDRLAVPASQRPLASAHR